MADTNFVTPSPDVSLGSTSSPKLDGADRDQALARIAAQLGAPGAHLGAGGLIVPAVAPDASAVHLWVAGGAMAVIRANDAAAPLDLSGKRQLHLVAPMDDDETAATAPMRARLDGKLVTLTPVPEGVSIQPAFPNVVLRVDASTTTGYDDAGSGLVNCQFGAAGLWERFRLVPANGGVAFESMGFPHVFIRLDGSGVTGYADSGAGTVNCQYGDAPGPWETFAIEVVEGGRLAFRSAAFPQLHLRVDASETTVSTGAGSGYVNAQYGAASLWESFVIGV